MIVPHALIVGAGPTGMTAAIELRRAGIDVRIIDKSEHMAQHSQALVLQARTLELLERYGVAEKAVERGRKLSQARIWSDGKEIVHFKLELISSRYPYVLFLPQTETEAILNEYMESHGARTERNTELMALERAEGRVRATLRRADGSEETIEPRWLIGCDGARSVVRQKSNIPFEGGGVGLSFFLGDLVIEGEDAPSDELAVHFQHGDVVFMGRLTDRLTRLIVASHARQNEDTKRELTIADFQQAIDSAGIKVKVLAGEWMTPFRVNDLQARHYRLGNIFLAGDASHIHSPVGGQGMNTGMQDAANLGWKLAAVARGANESLLDSYEQERAEVGKALLKFTERALKLGTSTNPAIIHLRDTLMPIFSSLTPVRKSVAGFISETAIEYRSSAAVDDRGGDGDLRAGDRIPDLSLGDTTLLHGWTEANHLAIALDVTPEQAAAIQSAMPRTRVISVHSVQLDDEGRRLLGEEKKLFILRPDGYIGYRGPVDQAAFAHYAAQDALA